MAATREDMVSLLRRQPIHDERVLAAMARVPTELLDPRAQPRVLQVGTHGAVDFVPLRGAAGFPG